MFTDTLCAVSWRARPRSFVSLMTLYESNYIRLGWLLPETRVLPARAISEVAGDCPLELVVLERARYTTTATLSYLLDDAGGASREPGLQLRVYHDARLAETVSVGAARAGLARLDSQLPRAADSRWSGNMLLNKWLEYCADRGHRFAPHPA